MNRAADVIGRAMALLGHEPAEVELGDAEETQALLELTLELVVERLRAGGDPRPLGELVVALEHCLREVRAHADNQRLDALARVNGGLSRLRSAGGVDELLREAVVEIARAGDFDCVLLLSVEGGHATVTAQHPEGPAWDTVSLVPGLAETEVVRRRTAVIVGEGGASGRPPASAATRGGGPYVAAPVMSGGRVVALVEADRTVSGRPLRRLDRDVALAFAVGLGYALERTVLNERLHAQRQEVSRLVRATEQVMRQLATAQIEVGRVDDPAATIGPAATLLAPVRSELDAILTPREMDVLEAMAAGATNAQIAAQLFIAEATVKSHVKRILRKLGASNRAQAVSRLFSLTGLPRS